MNDVDVVPRPTGATQPTGRTRPITADLLGLLAVASCVVTTWLWVRTGGVQQTILYPSMAMDSLGLYTGLMASNLMILQVFYLARIPWVEQSWGHDVLAHRHRLLGLWSFWLMIAHVVAFALQRMGRAPEEKLAALWTVFVTDSWMLLASLGTLMLILVVITSIRMARRRLRYESWHLLHLYSYLGMGLALPHQLFDGMHFHELWAQLYWWGMYLIALAAIIGYRLALPLWRSAHHRITVTSVKPETPGVVSILMQGHRLDKLRTKSGQFFIWRFLDGNGWSRGNPYTISDAPDGDQLRITIQAAGDGSERAARLTPGTRVLIEGPYGTMTAQLRSRPGILMMAAGVGITPFRGLLEDTPYQPGEAVLIYRYSEDTHLIFRDELLELAERRGIRLIFLPGPRRDDNSWLPAGTTGDEVEILTTLVPDIAERDVFACGPPPWIRSVRKTTRAAGLPTQNFHHEDFAW